MRYSLRFLTPRKLVIIFCILLAIIPLFWMKPGEVDLGGDSSRLYFYDPLSYINNYSLYDIVPEGLGNLEPNYYFLPFVSLLFILKYIFSSTYLLISLFNILKLVGGFLGMYFIIREFIKTEKITNSWSATIAGILGGLFYVFTPTMIGNYDKAILSHNQVFLNPIIFFLVLKFLLTKNNNYLVSTLLLTFIFSPNFGFTSEPPFFAFYPLAFLFMFVYVLFVRKKSIPWKGLSIGFFVFFCLQAFHLIPQIMSLLDPGSVSNTRIFNRQSIIHEGVNYFMAILPTATVVGNILPCWPLQEITLVPFLVAPTVFLAFLFKSRVKKAYLLTSVFFIISLYLLSAKISNLGILVYQDLFYIPGFSMFRNFIGQWLFIFEFMYALLFGQAVSLILKERSVSFIKIFTIISVLMITISAWKF